MRRSCILLLLAAMLLSPALVSVGYAFFVYSDGSAVVGVESSFSNALFDEADNNDYYRVYFFASPYYATGAEIGGSTVTDPLKIANSASNPYNVDTAYMMCGNKLNGSNNRKYANVLFSDGNYHYISYKSKSLDVLDGREALEPFALKDYTGYIRPNADLQITDQTSTYVSLTVKGNISMEQLQGIVAATEFKDQYGFGPEFIGWTYNQEAAAKRAMYGSARYKVNTDELWACDKRGYKLASAPHYQYGNFGCQGEIAQISATTSLKALDKTTKDGSAVDDKIIYLYPVFSAKNYSADKNVGGTSTAILKFRVNADNTRDENGQPLYEYRQSAEIDYSLGRYTVGFFQNVLNDEKNNINYYTRNFYLGAAAVQLDVCPPTGATQWAASWTTLLSSAEMAALGLEEGFYDIDITFVLLDSYGGGSYAAAIEALCAQYSATEQYEKIFSSLQKEETGVVAMPYEGAKKRDAYFVIGFQKVEELHLVGDGFNNAITDYHAKGYSLLHTTEQLGEHVQYMADRVYLKKDSSLSVLADFANGTVGATLPYTITAVSESVLAEIKAHTGTDFYTVGNSADSDLWVDGNTLKVSRAGSYTLVFSVKHEGGRISNISVAYCKNERRYSFVVLSEKPAQAYFTDKKALAPQILVQCEAAVRSYLKKDTVLNDVHAKTDAQAAITDIESLFAAHTGKRMYDTATGEELTATLFEEGRFCLNRHYVVYFE